jgi:SAM-dependent methyltransferase
VPELYDRIGEGYRLYRRPDPRIAAAITLALGPARTVVNVGAGPGSYEPAERVVVAVEPSAVMIRQRPRSQRSARNPRVVQASATALPFGDGAFDAALAVLTVHHWPDRARGLAEMRRVARDRVVLFTWDPARRGFWLEDYFPALSLDREIFPSMEELRDVLGPIDARLLPIPHDCVDGFLGAYWRRPEAYLEPAVRSAISTFSKIEVEPGLRRLRHDLEDGTWTRRYGHLRTRTELDLGYRVVVATGPFPQPAPQKAEGDPPTLSPPGRGQGEGLQDEGLQGEGLQGEGPLSAPPASPPPERTPPRRARKR